MFPLKEEKIGGYRFGEKTWYSARHLGVDYVAPKGTTVYAPFDGEVVKQFWGVQGGNTIWFKPKNKIFIMRFMHLADFVGKTGQVKSGQVIGHTGNTGLLTKGAHLHLDISQVIVNPFDFNNFIDPESFKWENQPNGDNVDIEAKDVNGIDVSHYQKINWTNVTTGFVIAKCTESINYLDPTYNKNKSECRKKGILFGAYHFARGGDVKKEATWFVKNVGDLQDGELLALDWEINHPIAVAWCLKFLQEVEQQVRFKPLIYLNSATAKSLDWTPVIKNNNGLWIANYNVNDGTRHDNPPIGKWPFYAIHQYTSKGRVAGIVGNVDLNYANCPLSVLKKYGAK